MPETQPSPTFCEERKGLDQELSKLLRSKSAIREQVSGEIIANPAKRRATLVRTRRDNRRCHCVMNEHYKHCSCGRRDPAKTSVPVPGAGARRDQIA